MESGEAQEGGDIRIIMTDLPCCTAETSTTLQSTFPPIKERKKKSLFLFFLKNFYLFIYLFILFFSLILKPMGLGVCDYGHFATINVHPSVTFLIQDAYVIPTQRPKENSSTVGRF